MTDNTMREGKLWAFLHDSIHEAYKKLRTTGTSNEYHALLDSIASKVADDVDARFLQAAQSMPALPELVSVDVSTGDEDAGHRIFAKPLHMQGTTLICEESSRNFSQPAPVVGELVAWVNAARLSKVRKGYLLNVYLHGEAGSEIDNLVPLVVRPTNYIPATELERLRKDAERLPALEHTLRHLGRELAKLDKYRLCMSYNDSYFGEPAGAVKRVVVELRHCIDAAIAGEKK